MNRVITELYETKGQQDPMKLDMNQVMELFSPKRELRVLSTCHWAFDVNVPVTVSMMVSKEQKTLPFWIPGSGFRKTTMTVKNRQNNLRYLAKAIFKGQSRFGCKRF